MCNTVALSSWENGVPFSGVAIGVSVAKGPWNSAPSPLRFRDPQFVTVTLTPLPCLWPLPPILPGGVKQELEIQWTLGETAPLYS